MLELLAYSWKWITPLNAEQAAPKLTAAQANLDQTWFAWSGSTVSGQPIYYRVQSPKFTIEFAHQQGSGAKRAESRTFIPSTVRTATTTAHRTESVPFLRHSPARWTAAAMLAVAGTGLAAAPAQAHPSDEIIQQIYLTSTHSRLDVELDLTPGVLLAPTFARTVDSDHDHRISDRETAAHIHRVVSTLRLRVDSAPVR
ncbi:DUF3500 domain-containing protein [Streptomyces sp. NPDC001443]